MEEEELLEYVEELESLEELPSDVLKELREEEKEWIEIRVRKHVWQALNKLKQAWGTKSHSSTIERLIRIAAARRNELRCVDEEDKLAKKFLDFLVEHGDDIMQFVKSLAKKEVRA